MTITKRQLGGRQVCPIGLGCMSLSFAYGYQPPDDVGEALLHRALDLGYDHLDTARIYGVGHSETLIGRTLKGMRERFYLASKTGIFPKDGHRRMIDNSPESIREGCEASLRALQTDHIDLYYLHRLDNRTPIEESVGTLAELVKEGKIGGIGLSEVSAAMLRRAAAVHPITAVQTEYSLWTRNPEIAVLDTCRELGTTFVAFSPLGRGVLANGFRDLAAMDAEDFRATIPRFLPENWPSNLALVDQFNAIAAAECVTPAQLSLAWVLSRGDHVVAIPGTGNIDHMAENIARWEWQPSAAVMAQLEQLLNQNTVVGDRYADMMKVHVSTEDFV